MTKITSFMGMNVLEAINHGDGEMDISLYPANGRDGSSGSGTFKVSDVVELVTGLAEEEPDLTVVRTALSRMPYLPASGYSSDKVKTVDDLATLLTRFGDYLRDHADTMEAIRRERDDLRAQRAAVRELLGTGVWAWVTAGQLK